MNTQTLDEGVIAVENVAIAAQRATEIFQQLTANDRVRMSLDHQPAKRQFKLYGVSDADLIKTLAPEFDIKQDQYMRRYAELYITYDQ